MKYDPINTIAFYDKEDTIRTVDLSDDINEYIWNSLPAPAKKNQKMKRYFKYRLDNPPLAIVISFVPNQLDSIEYVKGHGMSPVVRIPKSIDKDLAYILVH